MYCEKCGRKLEEGEICPCKKKPRKKIRFNGKVICSFLICAGGVLVFKYFYENQTNILDMIPLDIISDIKGYIQKGMVALIFLIGMIVGIFAIKKRSWRILSWITMIANLVGMLLLCLLIGWNGYQYVKVIQMVQGELSDTNLQKIRSVYDKATLEDSVREEIKKGLNDRAKSIENTFNEEELSLEEAVNQLDMIDTLNILDEEIENVRQNINSLNISKENYKDAEELEKNDADLLKSIKLYEQVIEEDLNYDQAQEKMLKIDGRVEDIIDAGITQQNIEIFVSYYQDADTARNTLIDQKVLENEEKIKKAFTDQKMSYEAAVSQLDELKEFTGVYGEILLTEEYVDNLNQSREDYKEAEELEKNKDTVMEAVLCYQRVIEEDSNYEKAQKRADELLNSLAEDCKSEVDKLLKEQKYQEALTLIDSCMETSTDNAELSLLRQECVNKYSEYALNEMERLLGERKYDEAKQIVSEAYAVTNNQDLQNKIASIDTLRPISLTELHVIDGNNYEVREEVTDSYGNTHHDVMHFDLANEAYVKYQLNGEYSSLSGNLVVTEDTSSSASCSFAIFADGQILYSLTDYTRQQDAQNIELDLSGISELVIRCKDMSNWNYPKMCLTECVLDKEISPVIAEKKYERLSDNTVIDSARAEYIDGLVQDTYGNLHDCGMKLNTEEGGYILYNLNQKYANFSGNLVVSRSTDADAEIKVQIYVDDLLVFEQSNIDKTVERIPISIDVTNGKVLKITSSEEYDYWITADIFIADDRLYFEKTEEMEAAEAETLAQVKKNDTTEGGIHRYEYYLLDNTWEAAYYECLARGGHLVRINSPEEYNYIVQELNNKNCQDYIFYIGARRDLGTEHYYWAENSNALSGPVLDAEDAWCKDYWLEGEPTRKDSTLNVEEHVMMMFYHDDLGKWVWNDVPNNLNEVMPTYKGKLGYICEYEN